MSNRVDWGAETPSGWTYKTPKTIPDIMERGIDYAQGDVENWDEAELPPDPTWEMVAILLDEIDRLKRLPSLTLADFNAASPIGRQASFNKGVEAAVKEINHRISS